MRSAFIIEPHIVVDIVLCVIERLHHVTFDALTLQLTVIGFHKCIQVGRCVRNSFVKDTMEVTISGETVTDELRSIICSDDELLLTSTRFQMDLSSEDRLHHGTYHIVRPTGPTAEVAYNLPVVDIDDVTCHQKEPGLP